MALASFEILRYAQDDKREVRITSMWDSRDRPHCPTTLFHLLRLEQIHHFVPHRAIRARNDGAFPG